jgi:hypothetical protein
MEVSRIARYPLIFYKPYKFTAFAAHVVADMQRPRQPGAFLPPA